LTTTVNAQRLAGDKIAQRSGKKLNHARHLINAGDAV
jgi:hypothetical protein